MTFGRMDVRVAIKLGLALTMIAIMPPVFASNAKANAQINQPPQPATEQAALRLAAILSSEAIIIGDEKSDEKAADLMLQLFGSDEAMREAEKADPGIGKELADAVLPIINRYMRMRLPQLQQSQAALYARTFTNPEIETLVAFYMSPTGNKLVQNMIANIKPKAMLAEVQASDDFKMTSSSVLSDIRDTLPAIMAGLNADDLAVLNKLAQSGLLDRMKVVAPETQTIALEWMAEYAPGEETEIDATIEAIFAKREK